MKPFLIKYIFFKLIKTMPVTGRTAAEVKAQFKQDYGYPILRIIRDKN